MTDVIPLNPPKQILVSERDLRKFIDLLNTASESSSNLSILLRDLNKKARKKSHKISAFLSIGQKIAADLSDQIDWNREIFEEAYLNFPKKDYF